ncbi:TetR/AcrR family transcriptional regulator [Actinacidiphila sp. DG2A-62]|uniref:TetR/AcrR family transcriptional regulator n=1 Tax=Actinacidiphila sp. DG2A-62 TaxID=3108821 RepID=UPI002DBB54F7|nr:TetR/AcrR family transcriptional regulator [Actinacidiphila sp. DG2A-62]MEC3994543.1 TetR/AcrR family transcriptional regulator [Actinacidiphila sp. DG2A-62]
MDARRAPGRVEAARDPGAGTAATGAPGTATAPGSEGAAEPATGPRKPRRAQALRNREALVAVAREAFAAGEADIRVEEIARRAGVGVGTFYRHFSTREGIVEAVYDQRVRDLCAAAPGLLETLPPQDAIAAFLQQLVDHAAGSRSTAVALKAVMDLGSPVFPRARADMIDALGHLMSAAVAAGAIRADIGPETLFRAMSGICSSHDQPGWEPEARSIVRLLCAGLAAPAQGAATPGER